MSSIFELPEVSQGVSGSPRPWGIRNFRGALAGRPVSYVMCLLYPGRRGGGRSRKMTTTNGRRRQRLRRRRRSPPLPEVSQGASGSPRPWGIINFRGTPAGRPVSYMMCLLYPGRRGRGRNRKVTTTTTAAKTTKSSSRSSSAAPEGGDDGDDRPTTTATTTTTTGPAPPQASGRGRLSRGGELAGLE